MTRKEIISLIGFYLILDGLISLAWGLQGDCLACLNNSQIGNIIRIIRILAGVYIIKNG